ncbi:hypothetical protein JYB62_02210 [Algoriphagus lutimaris]|uniref:hypothetical protein n=1 Tax=Algoriphagus lutimaris TaxID=613197 RepID=UPI00196B4AE1|nr:hypothetical protein [Algoriphagus lutimaris]MBN3518803.1 hypothetical protein [Algoriphagus lutimaris]
MLRINVFTDVRKDVRFVDNGKWITTCGISAGIDGAILEFVLVDRPSDLHALINGEKFPLFFESVNVFSDGDLVYFERDSKGKVIGYRIQKEGTLYLKISVDC